MGCFPPCAPVPGAWRQSPTPGTGPGMGCQDPFPTAGRALTGGPQTGGDGGAAQPELHLAGVDHDTVVGAEVAGVDNAGRVVASHQQVVGVGGLAGFHLKVPTLDPHAFIQVFLFVLIVI